MEKQQLLRKIGIQAAIVALFIAVSYLYFFPLLEGKQLAAHDIQSHIGMSKELADYRAKTGEEAVWTNAMFSGMPGYMISVLYPTNLVGKLQSWFRMLFHPAAMLILYLVGFYVLLTTLKVNRWLSVAGALAFGFSTYQIIIIGAGHNTKAYAVGYLMLVVAGVLMAYRGNRIKGALLTAFALAMNIQVVHPQITYYGMLALGVFAITEGIYSVREKRLAGFLKTTGMLAVAALIAVAANFSYLYTTWEYSKETIRGKSELTHNSANQTSGLDKDYVVQWSQGIDETLTLLIPNFKGGSHSTHPGLDSESFKALQQNNIENPRQVISAVIMYHGDKPVTSGPYYAGAIIIFLFVLGLFIVKGADKWWLLAATLMSIVLAWGKNVMPLTSFLLDYLPLYNKFRAPEMILVVAGFTIPLLGFLGLQQIISGKVEKKEFRQALKWSFGITGGITLLFFLFPGIAGNFVAPYDQQAFPDWLQEAVRSDRRFLLKADAIRSFLFIAAAAGALLLWHLNKLKSNQFFLILAVLVLTDLWMVDKRFLNNSNFITKRESQNIYPEMPVDQEILKDTDLSYRVLPLNNPWGDSRASYFHKNVGGYHAAKLRRYQELIDHHLSPEMGKMIDRLNRQQPFDSVFDALPALNMLNTRYLIYDLNSPPLHNPKALGNAWFVKNFRIVPNADQEINELGDIDPAQTALVDQRFASLVEGKTFAPDSTAAIRLTEYQPNYLKYTSKSASEQLAVFSEIYYQNGWKAFVDGVETPHFRVDYVLRAMVVPAGEHTVEFRFEPRSYYLGNQVSLAGSLLLILLIAGYAFREIRKQKPQATAPEKA